MNIEQINKWPINITGIQKKSYFGRRHGFWIFENRLGVPILSIDRKFSTYKEELSIYGTFYWSTEKYLIGNDSSNYKWTLKFDKDEWKG